MNNDLNVCIAEFDDAQAISEGWCISEMVPPIHADEPFQLEAVANPEIGPMLFNNDDDAVAFVVRHAEAGSAYHLQALRYLEAHSPRELVNFPSIADALSKATPVSPAVEAV